MEDILVKKLKVYNDLGKTLASFKTLVKDATNQLDDLNLSRLMRDRLENQISEYREVSFCFIFMLKFFWIKFEILFSFPVP